MAITSAQVKTMNTATDVLTIVSAAFVVGFISHWVISTVHPKGP